MNVEQLSSAVRTARRRYPADAKIFGSADAQRRLRKRYDIDAILLRPARQLGTMVLIWLSVVLSGGCNWPTSSSPEIALLVAASLKDTAAEIAKNYERQRGVRVLVVTGPSNGLAQQILRGARSDVFISAHAEWIGPLRESGIVMETDELASNRINLVVPTGNPANIRSARDLTGDTLRRVAIAANNVPAGIYARQVLKAQRLLEPLEAAGRLAYGSDARATLAFVELGEVDAGLVYASDAHASKKIEVVEEFDDATHDPIVYIAVLLGNDTNSVESKRFFDFLSSPDAGAVFAKHQFASLPVEKN